MTALVFDASDVIEFGGRAEAAAGIVKQEMQTAASTVIAEGIGIAQANAPRDTGFLAGSIGIIEPPSPSGGSFGTSVIYAWMREKGGTITGNPFLVFQTRDGRWVKVRSVTQTGTHYMERTANQLKARADAVYSAAMARVIARIGGG